MMTFWQRLRFKIFGGLKWTCPACGETFFSSDLFDIKPFIKKHVTTVHNFQWDDHKLVSHNLIDFLGEAGLLEA